MGGPPLPEPQPSGNSRPFRVLHMFSGPSSRKDSLSAYLRAVGIDADDMDTVNVDEVDQDVLDDSTWRRIKAKLQDGYYDFVFGGPPCKTFSASRNNRPGPPVLRDAAHPYGFPKSKAKLYKLTPQHFEQIRKDNLLAERMAEACDIMRGLGRGYCVEQPVPWGGAITMFSFESFRKLLRAGAKTSVLDQCMHEGPTRKPTALLYGNCDFSELEASCNHEPSEQVDSKGNTYMSPHPSYVGEKADDGSYLTQELAAYPAELNCKMATIINRTVRGY